MTKNNPVEAVPSKPSGPEKRADVSPATQRAETPEQQKERLERERDVKRGEEEEKAEKERLALREKAGASVKPSSSEAAKTEAEEDTGTNKGAMDKIGDGVQKVFAMVEKFMKQIQAMGSSTLRGMAKTLGTLGFKKAAEWLNEMAGADYAELMSAMKRGNLSLAAINPEDADAKAKGEAAEGAQTLMAERFKVLAQTRGPAFNREIYYSEVVAAWKKKESNGSKTQITSEDLRAMAAAAEALPATLPGQVAQAPAVPTGAEKPENFPTIDNLAVGTTDLMKPTKINFNNQVVTVQALADGFMINGLHYRATHIQSNAVPTFTRVVRSANGITIKGSVGIFANEKELPLENAKELLAALSSGIGSYTKGDFRFDRV